MPGFRVVQAQVPFVPEGHVPRCGRCGHHAAAHDGDGHAEDEKPRFDGERQYGWCLVNAHDDATGPECECDGYVAPPVQSIAQEQP